MLDAVKLIQSGYPTRIPYADIHSKYKLHMPERVQLLSPAQFCEVSAESPNPNPGPSPSRTLPLPLTLPPTLPLALALALPLTR